MGIRTTGAASLALYMLGDIALHYMSEITMGKRKEKEEWDDYCFICAEGGNLMCCERCPRTVHPQCIGLARAPKGDFWCFYCEMEKEKGGDKGSKKPKPQAKSDEKESTAKTNAASKSRSTADKRDATASGNKRERDAAVADSGRAEKARKTDNKSSAQEDLETLRRLLTRNGACNGSVAEIQPDSKAAKRDERWFVQVLEGDVINKKVNLFTLGVYAHVIVLVCARHSCMVCTCAICV
jgi:hypothetical protein